jgi:membrane-associated protein
MDLIMQAVDLLLHVDDSISDIIQWAGPWTYVLMFLIVFAETGLVVTPLLPGDSLLFALGAFAARGDLNLFGLLGLILVAAILGDTVNYAVGNFIGPRVFTDKIPFLNKEHLERTHSFFERYGGKTIILARFVPIVRTFAPFVAGVGSMTYPTFLFYNVIGALLWVPLCLVAGFVFGNNPWVKEHFEAVLLGIIFVSLLPAVFEVAREKLKSRQPAPPAAPAIEED